MRRTNQQKIFIYTIQGIYLKKIEELDGVEEKVAWLLKKQEHLRNCDRCLLFEFWKQVDDLVNLDTVDIHSLTSAETITRCRRHIQNDLGLFLPSEEEVIEARKISEEAVKNWSIMRKED